jgi:MAF protein
VALLGLPFDVLTAPIDERPREGETADGLTCRLSQKKAHAVACLVGESPAWILAADTVVVHNGEMLGKPADRAQAREYLTRLRDTAHEAVSGVTLLNALTFTQRTETYRTWVRMRAYSEPELLAYLESGDAMDKAGAYAIQHEAFHPVASLEGCYANVMGLPLCMVQRMLVEATGWALPALPETCARALRSACAVSLGTFDHASSSHQPLRLVARLQALPAKG